MTAVAFAFNPDEARDDHGKWSDGGGDGGSPSTQATRDLSASYKAAGGDSHAPSEDPKATDAVHAWAQSMEGLREPDGGFTVDPRTGEAVTSGISVGGYAPSSVTPADDFFSGDPPAGLKVIGDFVRQNASKFTDPAFHLGGWHDPASGNVFLDVTKIFPADQRAEALAAGAANNEISVADLDAITAGDWDHAIVSTGGTGGL